VIINIIVPKLNKSKFTGGLVCILHYANELHNKGHKVNIIPFMWLKRNSNLEDITMDIRGAQKVIGKDEQIPTGYQKMTFRRGDSFRNFMSPYQR